MQLKIIAALSLRHLHSATQLANPLAVRTFSQQVTALNNALGLLEAAHQQLPASPILMQTARLSAQLLNPAKSPKMHLQFAQTSQMQIVLVLDAF